MNLITEKSVKINSKISDIFAYISNMENYTDWFPEVIAIKSEDSQDHGIIGKKYLETIKIPFKGENEYSIVVKEFQKNERFVTEGEISPILPRMTVNLTQLSQKETQVKWKMESRSRNFLFKFLMLPLLKNVMSKRAHQGMTNLKQILEK